MNDLMLNVLWHTRRLSFVPRWVVLPVVRRQNVAEHSYHVTCIADMLLDYHIHRQSQSFRLEVLRGCLYHDKDEAVSGDAPGPSKDKVRRDPSTLTDAENVIKVADMVEAALFCREEMAMGNATMQPVYIDALKRGEKYWERFRWEPVKGPMPVYFDLLDRMAEKTSLNFHPILGAK